MQKIIYIEKEIKDHKRVKKIVNKFNKPTIIYIDRYTEVFNKKNQNFRLQKINPSIILAKKYDNFLLKTPSKYTIGKKNNFYFSYMYNCIFDCSYCFLQGLFNSSNFVIFINYEDFLKNIALQDHKNQKNGATIFSGYDCDSMAYDSITNFSETMLSTFDKFSNLELEIRTKSTYIKPFLRQALPNIVIAFSFTPDRFSSRYELGVANLSKRINIVKTLVKYGWNIGIRLDPFVIYEGWQKDYINLFRLLFESVPQNQLHSVTYGNIRYPKNIYKKIKKFYLNEKLFLKFENQKEGIYHEDNCDLINNFCENYLYKYVDRKKVHSNLNE